jgi:aspartyl/asparaginyl beta-hydroxylase (cupin superfamily)
VSIEHLRPTDRDGLISYLVVAGAGQYVHGGTRSLLDHLTGTRDILARWQQPEHLQLAGMLHSVYGTEVYAPQLLNPSARDELRGLAGERAERLAYLFGVVPRRRLLAALELDQTNDEPLVGLGDPDWTDETISRREADELALLHAANLAEQARSKAGPGQWLARVGGIGRLLGSSSLMVPPVLAELAPVTAATEALARQAYALALAGMSDDGAAERQLAQTLGACPALPEPYVWLAWLSLRAADWAAAEWWSDTAATRLAELGTPWDKRLSFEDWSQVIGLLQGRTRARSALAEGPAFTPRRLLEQLRGNPATGHGVASTDRAAFGRQRFHRYMDTFAIRTGDVRRRCYPGLESRPFHDPAEFGVAAYLEQNYAAINAEVTALDPGAFHREAEPIKRRGDWDVLFFSDRGRRNERNCESCPTIAYAIDNFPTMHTITGLIYLSRLRAGTHIAAHRGPTNFRLRCHLGIVVPDGDCAIRVGGETRHWQEGRCVVLDDYFEHEAWNHTDSDRIVLVCDLWHSGLTDMEVQLLTGLHRFAYRYAERQHRWWNQHYDDLHTAGR